MQKLLLAVVALGLNRPTLIAQRGDARPDARARALSRDLANCTHDEARDEDGEESTGSDDVRGIHDWIALSRASSSP
jgi:hypothetical protein